LGGAAGECDYRTEKLKLKRQHEEHSVGAESTTKHTDRIAEPSRLTR
jgi:hypothetical protein